MDKLGCMIVGPGWVAEEHIKAYCKDPRTDVRAIVGFIPEDEARARQYMDRHGFQADFVTDYDQALRRDDIDVVNVCTINWMHYENGLAAIEAGKHTVIEKPLVLKPEQMEALVEATRRKGVKTHVGHVCRFYPAVASLKHVMDAGEVGEIFYAECDYWHEIKGAWKVKVETGGSALLMGGCHSVDMVRWMMGEDREIAEVSAYSTPARWRTDFEYDPTICLMMKYKDGAVGKVATSLECNMPYVFHIQMCGTQGTVRNNGYYTEKFPDCNDFVRMTNQYPDDWNVSHHPFDVEMSYFVDCVVNDTESMLSFPAAAKTYEVIFAAEQSAREGKPVKLPILKI